MAQAGYTPISLYFSTTAAATPSAGNLVAGELALNTVDEKLYFKNSAGTVKLLASNATSAPVLTFSAGTTGFTPSSATSGAVTLAGTLATTNGGTGLTAFTANQVFYASSTSAVAQSANLTFNGTTLTANTIGAFTLSGTIAGGGNQINNVIIGTSTPLAGTFTQLDITAQGTLRLQDTTGGEYVALRAPATLGANYTLTFPADDGTSGQALITDGSGVLSWSTSASGDVYGPASSTANGIVLFDGTTGKLIKDSAAQDGLIYGLTVGRGAGAVSTNTAVGASALAANTTGSFSTAIGAGALAAQNGAVQNVAVGNDAAGKLTSGTQNTAMGISALGWGVVSATTGSYNAAYGQAALYLLTSGSYNTALGAQALYSNTSSSYNTAVGYQAGYSITTGANNQVFGPSSMDQSAGVTGSENVVVGRTSMRPLTSGSNNSSVGNFALSGLTTGTENVAVGYSALALNSSGIRLTAVGAYAGYKATANDGGVFVGLSAGYNTTSGAFNVFVGGYDSASYPTGFTNVTGAYNTVIGAGAFAFGATSGNTAVGYQAGYNSTGGDNTAIGYVAGKSLSSGVYNIVVGPNSMDNSAGVTGDDNVAVGRISMRLLTSGDSNTAVGNGALGSVSTANNNVAVGYSALSVNNASNNVAVGYQAGASNTSGDSNVFIGLQSAYYNTTGSSNVSLGYGAFSSNNGTANGTGTQNVAIGRESLQNNTSASNNTAVGFSSLSTNTTGASNTAVGFYAGYTNSSGAVNTYVGYRAGVSATGSYNTFVGSGATDGAGAAITTGTKNTILGGYNGNQNSLDIRTASNYIVLSDGDGNPRGFFDGSGNFLVNKISYGSVTGIGSQIGAGGAAIFTTANDAGVYLNRTGTDGRIADFYKDGSQVGSITVTTTVTTYNSTSDYRLKTVIGPVADAGQRIDALQPVEYTWNADGSRTRGFLAHQFQEVYAKSVSGTKDAVDAEGKPVYQAMQASTSEVIADLVAEIKSLRQRLAAAGI